MSRKVFDILASAGGVVLVVVLLGGRWPVDVGLEFHPFKRPQTAFRAADLLPAEGGLRPCRARYRDHPR